MNNNNQNVLIAIALSFIILMGWQYFIAGPRMEQQQQREAAEQARTVDPAPEYP